MARTAARAYPTSGPTEVPSVLATQYGSLLAEIDEMRTRMSGTGLISAPGLVIGTTDKNIGTVAFGFHVNGVSEAKAAVAAGTALGAQTVTADKWALYRGSIAAGGTITITPAAGNVAGYATEALAIAAIPATPTGKVDLGYVTNLTKVGTAWIAGTDAFEGGASGNPAKTTNYYDAATTITTEQAKTLSKTR